MKKSIIYIALAALAAAACTRTVETETPVEGRLKTISISASGEQISKARLDFPRINWEESDKVAIFDGVAKREFSVTSCDGASARLSGDVAESAANLVAVSPLSAGISYEKGVLSVTLPSEQTVPDGACIDPSALLSVASAETGAALQFKNVPGLIRITVDRDGISEIILSASGPIAGTAAVNPATGVLESVSGGSNSIVIKPAGSSFAQGDYYAALLPGNIAAGFKVSAVAQGKSGVRETTSANEIKRSICLDKLLLSDIAWSTEISSYAQFKAWAEDGKESASLTADIAIPSTWTPVALEGVNLYGNGHTISGFEKENGSGPFGLFKSAKDCSFEDLSISGFNLESTSQFLGGLVGSATGSSFKNCSFDGKLQCTAKETWSGRGTVTSDANNFGVTGGLAGYAEGCTFEGCSYSGVISSFGKCTGGVCGYSKSSTIKNCKTSTDCEVYCYYHCAGLIAGAVTGDSAIEDCSAEGFVGCLGWFTGGIAGWFENGLIKHCVVGSHSYISSTQYDVGGIAGHMQAFAGGKAVVDRCTVYANVQGQYNVGGIVGYTCQKAAGTLAVTNCAYLEGDIFATGVNSNYYSLAAGICGWNQNTSGSVVFENNVARPALIKALNNREKRLTEPASYVYKTIGGVAGLLGFTNGAGTTTMSNCYTTLTKPEILVSHQGIDTFGSVFVNWGALYGKANTALVYGADCYKDSETQSGAGAPASTSGEVGLSVQQMTDGTLLGKLNASASKCTAAGIEPASWISGDFGYPVPDSVLPDPTPRESTTKRVSVCGDSISTFAGYIPASYAYHFPCSNTDHHYCECVRNVSQTYWYQVIYDYMKDARLDMNMSYSGSAVARSTNTDKNTNHWYTQCYTQRYLRQGGIGEPDVIILHGGTNDWAHNDNRLYPGSALCKSADAPSESALNDMFTTADSAVTREQIEGLDDTTFCTAYIKLLKLWNEQYPGVKIVCVIGDYLSEGVEKSILAIASHYGAKCVDLLQVNGFNDQTYMPKHDYNGSSGCHPGVAAMKFISNKIYTELGPWMENVSANKNAEASFERFDNLEQFTM